MSCPNINSPEWKELVSAVGEKIAYRVFAVDPELSSVGEVVRAKKANKYSFSRASKTSDEYARVLSSIAKANNEINFPTDFKELLKNGKIGDSADGYIGITTRNGLLNRIRYGTAITDDQAIQQDADKFYAGKAEDETMMHASLSNKPINKEQFIEIKKTQADFFRNQGKFMELILTIPITDPQSPQYAEFVAERDQLLVKLNTAKEAFATASDTEAYLYNLDQYKYALEDGSFPSRMFNIMGLDVLEPDSNTKYTFQANMASSSLKIQSVLDMLISHGDNVYSIYDFKAGTKFNRLTSSDYFGKFARQLSIDITSNSQDMARIQIMMEAILVRINNPQARFHDLAAIWIPDEASLRKRGSKFDIAHVQDYLFLLKQYLHSDPEFKDAIAILERADPGLFDYKNYTVIDPKSEKLRSIYDEPKNQLLEEIQQEIIHLQSFSDYVDEPTKKKNLEKIEQLFHMMVDLKPDNVTKTHGVQMSIKNIKDLSLGELYVGSIYNIKNPLLSQLTEILHEQLLKVTKEEQVKMKIFKSMMRGIIVEYSKSRDIGAYDKVRNLLSDSFSESSLRKILGTFDYKALYGWAYVERPASNGSGNKQFLATTEEQVIATVKGNPKLSYVLDSSGRVKAPFMRMLNFLNDTYASFLDEKRPDSMWNQVVSYKQTMADGRKDVTFGDEINSGDFRQKFPFHYEDGDFIRTPKTEDEFEFLQGIRKHLSFNYRKYFTNFNEFTFYEHGNTHEYIPLKGLPSRSTSNPDDYSISLEHQFNSFITNVLSKKHMTSAYALVEAVKAINTDPKTGKSKIPDFDKFVTAQQNLALKGRKPLLTKTFSRGLPFSMARRQKINTDDNGEVEYDINTITNFNLGKTLESMGMWTAKIRLGFLIPGGIKNALGITLSTITEAEKQSIMQKLYKSKHPSAARFVYDFTTMSALEFSSAFTEAMGLQVDGMRGKLEENKAWTLMNKFGYIPSISPLRPETKYYIAKQLSLLGMDAMLLPYSTMEEVVVAMFFVAQMKHIKIEQGPMKGKSMWDMYKREEITDEKTGVKYTDYVYEGENKGTPYLRGIIRDSQGNMTEMYGLSSKEVMAMHAIYEEKQGGFSTFDRTFLESNIFGAVMLQFRRELPALLMHGLQSHGPNYIKGRYQKSTELDKNGNVIYEFTPKMVEGKWITALGVLLHLLGAANKNTLGRNDTFKKFTDSIFPNSFDDYAIKKLDQGQIENLIDAGLTATVGAAMYALSVLAYGGRDDDDKAKALANRVIQQVTQQWNIMAAIKSMTDKPASFKTIVTLSQGVWQMSASYLLYGIDSMYDSTLIDETDYSTQSGNMRGSNEVLKNLPIYSATKTTMETYNSFVNDDE